MTDHIYVEGCLSEPDYMCVGCLSVLEFTPATPVWKEGESLEESTDRNLRQRPHPSLTCPNCGEAVCHRNEYDG